MKWRGWPRGGSGPTSTARRWTRFTPSPTRAARRPMVLIRGDNAARIHVESCIGEGEALRLGRE
eukprot:11372138-Alexandrium_andersonii.AAC.1